jgi:3-isopropylmalate/(R)-2-methylmalate dehydratase small subunit
MNQTISTTNAPIHSLTGTCVPLNRNNIDTDQIIPARFLKGTTKTGLGKRLFQDWRYEGDNDTPIPEFILNDTRYGGPILVAAHNFGCGSSREHAPWALKDYGFQAVLAISFADIFRNNALKNGLLTIALPELVIMQLLADVEAMPSLTVVIDLPSQNVTLPNQPAQPFTMDPYRKQCLLEGLDDIGYALSRAGDIDAYEKRYELLPQ